MQEFQRGTKPTVADTDGDTLNDGVETKTGTYVSPSDTGTDPLRPDSDTDGLTDGVEKNTGTFVDASNPGTNPNKADTDADTFSDSEEIAAGTNPVNAASKPAGPTPIGYWPMNDRNTTATDDASPGGNDGTLMGGITYVPGHTGQAGDFAMQFNGTDAGVTTGVSLLNSLDAFSMSGWVNFTEPQAARTALFGQNDTVEFGMISATSLELWTPTGGAINFAFGPSSEGWRHIAVTADSTGRRIYIDGVLAISGSVGTPTAAPADPFNIGFAVADNANNWYNGMIDDVAVWDVSLSADFIAQLASGAITPIGPAAPSTPFAITNVQFANATRQLTLTFQSEATKLYGIEILDAATNSQWVEISQVTATGASTDFSQVIPADVLYRLYRVRRLP